jgi:hypothetical protein
MFAGADIANLTPETLAPIAPFRVAQKILSYMKVFCFMGLMKPALVMFAIFVILQPSLLLQKYVDSVSTS